MKVKMKLFIFFVVFYLAYCQELTNPDVDKAATEDTDVTTEIILDDTSISENSSESVTGNISEDTTIQPIENTTTITEEITSPEITTTSIPILVLSDNNDVLSWSPKSSESIIVEAAEGYKIGVNVTECSLDGGNGDYVTITTDQYTNGLLFTYGVSSKPSYLYNNNRLFCDFSGTNASNFTVVFSAIGEAYVTTTTETPTTGIILPVPGANDSSSLLVYLGGRNINDYLDPDVLNSIRNAVGDMALQYCQNENFPLNGTVTSENVIINYIVPCRTGWPNSDICVQFNFSVPVDLLQDTDSFWTGYQMTTAHLRIMWDRYAETYLPGDISVYTPPGSGSFKWGVAYLLIGTLIFAITLLAIRHYGMKVSKLMRRRKLSDTASIISGSDRNSQISLPPHYLQDTPALFENAYPMYNPEKNPDYLEPTYPKSFEYSNYQELSMDLEKQDNEDSKVEESGA